MSQISSNFNETVESTNNIMNSISTERKAQSTLQEFISKFNAKQLHKTYNPYNKTNKETLKHHLNATNRQTTIKFSSIINQSHPEENISTKFKSWQEYVT